MSKNSPIDEGRELLARLAVICSQVPDNQIRTLFGDGTLDRFLSAIFNPNRVCEYPSIGEFFLANKNRSATMASIRSAITRVCAIEGANQQGTTGYVSPTEMQWFENAVMILEGRGPFEGSLCKYEDGHVTYAVMARDVIEGESLGPDAFLFVDIEEAMNHFGNKKPPTAHELEVPIEKLRSLLNANDPDEGKYQELLVHHPWVLGLQYDSILRHDKLDDKNIPDFTGVRVSDKCRDIFEIKPPTMPVFRSDGEFTAPFNDAWNQSERYLNFAREEADYLRRKGLRFDNPKCTLVCGYNLPTDQVKKIRVKERMNPALQMLTFNDLLAFMQSTAKFIQKVAS